MFSLIWEQTLFYPQTEQLSFQPQLQNFKFLLVLEAETLLQALLFSFSRLLKTKPFKHALQTLFSFFYHTFSC